MLSNLHFRVKVTFRSPPRLPFSPELPSGFGRELGSTELDEVSRTV
ncbi:MAG: hypothetical protein WD738_19585 [Pirellulales bacterium]